MLHFSKSHRHQDLLLLIGSLMSIIALLPYPSQAEVKTSISAGPSLSIPLGNNGVLLNQPGGFQLRGSLSNEDFGFSAPIQLSATYTAYSPKNMGSSSLGIYGLYLGTSTFQDNTSHFLSPYAAFELGTVYETLNLGNISNSISNSSWGFSARAIPGISIPISSSFTAQIEAPITGVWSKSSLYVWSTQFLLRWKR